MKKIIVYKSTGYGDLRYCIATLISETPKLYKVKNIKELSFSYSDYRSNIYKDEMVAIFDENKIKDVCAILDELKKEKESCDEKKRKAILYTAEKIKKCVEESNGRTM